MRKVEQRALWFEGSAVQRRVPEACDRGEMFRRRVALVMVVPVARVSLVMHEHLWDATIKDQSGSNQLFSAFVAKTMGETGLVDVHIAVTSEFMHIYTGSLPAKAPAKTNKVVRTAAKAHASVGRVFVPGYDPGINYPAVNRYINETLRGPKS